MATIKKQQQITRVSDLPIFNKLMDGMKTIVAYNKKNYLLDISNIAGRKIINMSEIASDESGAANTIYIDFNDKKTEKIVVYNGTKGETGGKGNIGEKGNQGEDGYINPRTTGVTGTLYVVNNNVTDNGELPWSAFMGKSMNDRIYELNETFITEDEFNLLFNDIKYIYAEFKTTEDNQSARIFNNDVNSHIVYKKYWTFEDDGTGTYYIYNPASDSYDSVNVDLWKDIYLGNTSGYFPITSNMNIDSTILYYIDLYDNSYKEVGKSISTITNEHGEQEDVYIGDKYIDNYYLPEIDAYLNCKYTISNAKWSFNLVATSEYVPDVYRTIDGINYNKLTKEEVLAIDTTIYAQYYKFENNEYILIDNIASYLAKPLVRYYKRNFVENGASYDPVHNNKYCEVPISEINFDSLTEDFIITSFDRLSNVYTLERHYPGELYGEPVQFMDSVSISNIDLYYYTESRVYYSNVITRNDDGEAIPTFVPITIPNWIYAEFKTTDEDQLSLILNANDALGEEDNTVIDNTAEDLDTTVPEETIFRIVPGNKKPLYIKKGDERYELVDLSKDPIYDSSEYYIFDNGYVRVENPEQYLSTYDFVLFYGEPKTLPISIYPLTNRSFVTLEYDPAKLVFYENGRIAATIGDNYETIIKISSENSNATAFVNVKLTTPVKSIELDESNITSIDVNDSTVIKYTILPGTAEHKEINWTYNDEIVTVTNVDNGIKVDGIGVGTINIIGNAADGFGAKATIDFEVVRPAESIEWGENETINYIEPIYYTPAEVFNYNNIEHFEEIEAGTLQPISTSDIKIAGYYQMVALLHKEYVINTIVSPSDTSYPGIDWESTRPNIAQVLESQITVIDTPEVRRIVTAEDIAENNKDANGNVLTEEQIGTEVIFVNAVTHKETIYVLNSYAIGEADITGKVSRYPNLKLSLHVRVDQSIETINVYPETLSMNVNTRKKLSAEILPTTAINGTISWHSSNTSVATVSPTGTVNAVGIGSTSIIAHAEDGSEVDGYCSLTVTIPSKDIRLDGETQNGIIYLGIGKTTTITADVVHDSSYGYDTSSMNNEVNWLSSDENVATIEENDNNGIITGLSLGKTTIIANAKDGSGVFGSIQVQVIKLAENVSFDFEEIEMELGDSLVLIPKFIPIDTTNEIVVWKSSDETIAKVKESGIVYALSKGTATITASTTDGSELTATCIITIS